MGVRLLLNLRFGHRGLGCCRGRLLAAELLRRLYKGLWIFSKLFLHARVSAQILLKFRMVLPVFFVLGQRGILGELLGDRGMPAQELSKACQFSLRGVVI